MVELSTTAPSEFVSLSLLGFTLWWVGILSVHLISCIYAACYAYFYWIFDATFLSYVLSVYDIGISLEYFFTIVCVHIALAAAHGVCVLLMVVGSLWRRTLIFFPWSITKSQPPPAVSKGSSNQVNRIQDDTDEESTMYSRVLIAAMHSYGKAKSIYAKFAYRHGIFGVNGRYFYVILICREIVETAFQTVQAFQMSKYLSSRVLNHLYISLLVINCWSSVLVHARLFGKDEARRRLATIVCDCALDIMSAMGVTVMIALHYVEIYDPELKDFRFELLEDDAWMAELLDEARLVLVVYWSDLAKHAIFSLGVITTTTSLKSLLRWSPTRANRIAHASSAVRLHPIEPWISNSMTPGDNKISDGAPKMLQVTRGLWRCCSSCTSRVGPVALTAARGGFLVWGIVVLALHLQASLRVPLVECNPKVKPMAGALPACFAVEFNCHELGISGFKEEVEAEWERFDHNTVMKLYILHCSSFEVPASILNFGRLRQMWTYNSTIQDWSAEAALTNTRVPSLTDLSLVRTNMSGGVLPLGLQSLDFPSSILSIYFCETNLQSLPDNLDLKWHQGLNIFIENSNLTVVPSTLIRLQPIFLSLAGNPITEVPAELIAPNIIQCLVLRRTRLRELPANVTQSMGGFGYLDFSDTEISFFWSWIDPFVEVTQTMYLRLVAGGSPYCFELEKIMNGDLTEFSATFQSGYSPLLMNSSESNWDNLRQSMDCSPSVSPTEFPLAYWDSMRSIGES